MRKLITWFRPVHYVNFQMVTMQEFKPTGKNNEKSLIFVNLKTARDQDTNIRSIDYYLSIKNFFRGDSSICKAAAQSGIKVGTEFRPRKLQQKFSYKFTRTFQNGITGIPGSKSSSIWIFETPRQELMPKEESKILKIQLLNNSKSNYSKINY